MPLGPEQIHKELDLIQDVVKRMATNSFEVKKWLIGILTAIVVFKNDELLGGNMNFIWLLLVPVICFWYLDAFFLRTERLYRELYKWVVTNRPFTDAYLYDLNTMKRVNHQNVEVNFSENIPGILKVALSTTLWPFYTVPLVFIIAYALLQSCAHSCHP